MDDNDDNDNDGRQSMGILFASSLIMLHSHAYTSCGCSLSNQKQLSVKVNKKGEYSGSNTRSACWKTNLRSDGNGIRRYYAHTFCAMVKLSDM